MLFGIDVNFPGGDVDFMKASWRTVPTTKFLEFVLALLGTLMLSILCERIDAFGRLAAFVEQHEAWQLDELMIVLLCGGIAAGVMLLRHSRELRREVSRRQVAEEAAAELSRQSLSYIITERRSLEDSARANEQRLESIIATARQSIVTIDRHGMISGWNQHAELTFGWGVDEVIGQRMSEIIMPTEMREAHEAGLARFMDTGTARLIGSRIEVMAMRRNGDVFPIGSSPL
jgi:PAS domain S-box-containing protein